MGNLYFDKEGMHKKQNLDNDRYEMPEEEFTNIMSQIQNSEDLLILDWDDDLKKPFIKNLTKDLEYKKERMRKLRVSECFPIINRGALWYNSLAETQKEELEIWYNAWLNVTISNVIPQKPEWLK